MESYIIEVLKQENEHLRMIISEYLTKSLEACKKSEEATLVTLEKFSLYTKQKESVIEFDDLKICIPGLEEFKIATAPNELPLPSSPILDNFDSMKIFTDSYFNHSLFIHFQKDSPSNEFSKITKTELIILMNSYFKELNWISPIQDVLIKTNVMEIQFFCDNYKQIAYESLKNKKDLFNVEIKKVLKFNHEELIQNCNKKILQFLYNLQEIKPVNIGERFSFATLFIILELLSKFHILKYEMNFNFVTIFLEGSKFQLNHTKKYLNYSDCFTLHNHFDMIGIFF